MESVNLGGYAIPGNCMQLSKGGLAGKPRISGVLRLRWQTELTVRDVARLITMSTFGRFHSELLANLDFGFSRPSLRLCYLAWRLPKVFRKASGGMSTRIPTYDCALQTTLLTFNHGQRRQDELSRDRR